MKFRAPKEQSTSITTNPDRFEWPEIKKEDRLLSNKAACPLFLNDIMMIQS
jgi:hypothetical protein